MPRAVSYTAETGVRESLSRNNALRTPAPRPTAASMNTPHTDGRAEMDSGNGGDRNLRTTGPLFFRWRLLGISHLLLARDARGPVPKRAGGPFTQTRLPECPTRCGSPRAHDSARRANSATSRRSVTIGTGSSPFAAAPSGLNHTV